MNAITRRLALAALCCLAVAPGAAAQKGQVNLAEELERIHILMLIDSDSNLEKSVRVDKKRLTAMWERTIPRNRYQLTVLEGKKATRKDIVAYYNDLKLGKNEGLVFFYAGHGLNDEKTGRHHLLLSCGDLVERRDLVKLMTAKKAELVVLLTDCCSTPQELTAPPLREQLPPQEKGKIHPTVRCLFFQARGLVNITAATNGPSWGDDDNGGVFTRALCQLLYWPVERLDAEPKDQFVDWQEFFVKLQGQTKTGFEVWKRHILARAAKEKRRKEGELATLADKNTRQVPLALDKLPARAARGWLMVCVKNELEDTLHYEFRLSTSGEKGWRARTLEPGQATLFRLPWQRGSRAAPRLELREKGQKKTELVDLEWWEGAELPKAEDCKKTFSFTSKK